MSRWPRARGIARAAVLPGAAALLLGAADPAPRAPDPRRGEALFVGVVPLVAGGAPCLGCHGVAGHGLARAASFGPDLTAAHQQYGADGLSAMLEDIVFPSMLPVYRGHAVTQDERADLVAFLGEASGAPSPALGAGYGAGIAAAMAGFLGLVLTIGRGGGRRARATSQEERP
jgi:mono/diheme cytochrome c family protein